MVIGDSASGRVIHFQVFYHLCEFLSGRRTCGLLPDFGGFKLDVVPADYVAAAIGASIASPEASGRILHLCSGPARALALDACGDLFRSLLAARGGAAAGHPPDPAALAAAGAADRRPRRSRARRPGSAHPASLPELSGGGASLRQLAHLPLPGGQGRGPAASGGVSGTRPGMVPRSAVMLETRRILPGSAYRNGAGASARWRRLGLDDKTFGAALRGLGLDASP